MLATVVRNHTRYCELPREFFFFPLAKEKFADRQALVYMRVVDYKKKKICFPSDKRTDERDCNISLARGAIAFVHGIANTRPAMLSLLLSI